MIKTTKALHLKDLDLSITSDYDEANIKLTFTVKQDNILIRRGMYANKTVFELASIKRGELEELADYLNKVLDCYDNQDIEEELTNGS